MLNMGLDHCLSEECLSCNLISIKCLVHSICSIITSWFDFHHFKNFMLGLKDKKFLLVASDVHSSDQCFEKLAEIAGSPDCLAFLYAGDLDIENYFITQSVQLRNFLFLPVQGNCDNRWSWTDVNLDLPLYRTCSFKGLKIFITHGHSMEVRALSALRTRISI